MVWPFSAKAHTWWKKWKWIRMLEARGDQLVQVPQEIKNTQIMSVCHPLHRFRVSRGDPLQGTMCVACHCPELWHGVPTIPRSFLSSFQPFLQQRQHLVLPTKLTEISFQVSLFRVLLLFGQREGQGWKRVEQSNAETGRNPAARVRTEAKGASSRIFVICSLCIFLKIIFTTLFWM